MTTPKIEWDGWDVYQGWNDFIIHRIQHEKHTHILWPTTNCPILIWLN